MTEDDAKTKWCPFGFTSSHPATNRWHALGPSAEDARCIGSACMAWRWQHKPDANSSAIPSGSGVCGLAGSQ